MYSELINCTLCSIVHEQFIERLLMYLVNPGRITFSPLIYNFVQI